MLDKLQSLKSCSVLKCARNELPDVDEKLAGTGKTFQCLKNTPQVKQQLEFIKKLDEEINETISRYKVTEVYRNRSLFPETVDLLRLKGLKGRA